MIFFIGDEKKKFFFILTWGTDKHMASIQMARMNLYEQQQIKENTILLDCGIYCSTKNYSLHLTALDNFDIVCERNGLQMATYLVREEKLIKKVCFVVGCLLVEGECLSLHTCFPKRFLL
jgi:hypothetical protein